MALQDHLLAEKASIIALLEAEYTEQNLRDSLLERLYYVRFLLGELGSGGGGGGETNYALEEGGHLQEIADATGIDNATVPTRTLLIGGQHDDKIENVKVDGQGRIIINPTAQQTVADSFSVVLASDHPVLPLPTGASTSALQTTGNTSLSSIDTKLILPTSLGAKTAANSFPVTLATDGVASGIAAQIGEVQTSPTANTVLARLKSIADALVSGIKTAASSFSVGLAQEQFATTQLTAPGSTPARSMAGYSKAYIQVVITNINTNVVVRIEGSNDGTNWANLSANNSDTTFTTNGTYAFQYQGCPANIRTTFVSETGGTAAVLDVTTSLSA